MKVKLTDRYIAGATSDERLDVSDAACPGLSLRLTPGGVKTFAVVYRRGGGKKGRNRRYTIGPWPEVSLADARAAAKDVRARARLGQDPQEEKQAARAEQPGAATFGDVLDKFVTANAHRFKKKTQDGYRQKAADHRLKALRARPAAAVRKYELREVLEPIAAKHPVMANRLLQFIKAAFSWAAADDLVPADPFSGMRPLRDEPEMSAEERTLSEAEVVKLWSAPGAPPVEHAYAKLMLLVGTRRNETALARWGDVDLDAGTWAVPPENRKGRKGRERGIVLPLAPLAVQVLRDLGPGKADEPVFGRVIANPDRAVKRLRKASGVKFSFHDLRATCATGCSATGAPPHVAAIVLGHARPPGVPDVTSKYDRADREAEVRSALAAWAARVERLVSGAEPARVVAWRRPKR